MLPSLTRRSFLKRSLIAAGALSTTGQLLSGPNLLAALNPGEKLKCVQIGCGGRGMTHLDSAIAKNGQVLYAMVDPDEKRHPVIKKWLADKSLAADQVQVFTDYRVMFDKIGKEIDAVFIATPNHHHALPAKMAMQLGKNVYCEKPVCHNVAEARLLREMARLYKVTTQMGNQGHCEPGYRLLYEVHSSRRDWQSHRNP